MKERCFDDPGVMDVAHSVEKMRVIEISACVRVGADNEAELACCDVAFAHLHTGKGARTIVTSDDVRTQVARWGLLTTASPRLRRMHFVCNG